MLFYKGLRQNYSRFDIQSTEKKEMTKHLKYADQFLDKILNQLCNSVKLLPMENAAATAFPIGDRLKQYVCTENR